MSRTLRDPSTSDPQVALQPPPEDDSAFHAWRQLFITFAKLQRRCDTILAPHNLVMSQFEAMIKVAIRPGCSQQELSAALLLTKGNIGALVDRLEGMEMLARQPDATDRRVNRLYLTPAGKELVSQIFKQHMALVREMMKPLSEPQLKQLRSLLQLLEPI